MLKNLSALTFWFDTMIGKKNLLQII